MKKIFILLSGVLLSACAQPTPKKEQHKLPEIVKELNQAHKHEAFKTAGVFSANLEIHFGGKSRLKAQMLYDTQTQETALLHEDGKILVFTNDTVWLSPDTITYPKARFDIFTWSYFMALPHKLNDQGLHFEKYTDSLLNGKSYRTQRLTFGKSVGDAPEDWYILYQDPSSGLLHAAAYIVTLNKDKQHAEEDPHAIVYKAYQNTGGIPIATEWEFYAWRKEKGLTQKLGEATLSNIEFLERKKAMFSLPASKQEVKL